MTENEGEKKPERATHAAFFYGTLMAPEVFYSVCYNNSKIPSEMAKRHSFTPAILHGYCRRRVMYADYPGITPDEKHQVFGTYVTGLSDANMFKLDTFEGPEYTRENVKVKLLTRVGDTKGDGNVEGEERTAEVYVFRSPERLEDKEWDLEQFRKEKLHIWTRDGYVFEDTNENERAYIASENPRW